MGECNIQWQKEQPRLCVILSVTLKYSSSCCLWHCGHEGDQSAHFISWLQNPNKSKNPKVTLPPTQTQSLSGRETKTFRGCQRAPSQEQGSASAPLLQCKGSQEQAQTTTVPTHIPCSHSQALGIAAAALITPASPVQTWQDFCYSSLVHTGQKIHLLGFALDLNTDFGWKGRSSSSRAPHWDHSSNTPPGTAFLWHAPTGLQTVFPGSPKGTPTQIFSSSWIHQKHTRRSSRTLGSAATGQSRGAGDGGQGTWVPSVTSWLQTQALTQPLAPEIRLLLLIKHLKSP